MTRVAKVGIGLAGAALLALGSARVVADLLVTRKAVAAFAGLVGAANAGDLAAVRSLCSAGYLRSRPPEPAGGGGVVGFPRNIHENFRVWRDGGVVLLCPTDRVGPVYRFVLEAGGWKFDGPAGLLGPGGRVEPMAIGDGPGGGIP